MTQRKRSTPKGKKTASAHSGPPDGAAPPAVDIIPPTKPDKPAHAPDDAGRPPRTDADPALFADVRPKRRRNRLLGMGLFAALIVAVVLYGLWPLIVEGVRPEPPVPPASVESSVAPETSAPVEALAPPVGPFSTRPMPDTTALEARIEALETGLTAIASSKETPLDAMGERITVLEAASEATLPLDVMTLEALVARLDQLDVRLALEGVSGAVPAAEVAALSKTLAALGARLDVLEAQRVAQPDLAAPLALVLGLSQLRDALARGAPYAAELHALAPLLAEQPEAAIVLDALRQGAERGVPTREALRARFAAVARAIVTAALAPEGAGWVDETLQKLAGVVSVRRTGDDIEGVSAEARVARAEVRLAGGELAGAVDELDGLEGAARNAARDWLSQARARLAAEAGLAELAELSRTLAASLVPVTDEAGLP